MNIDERRLLFISYAYPPTGGGGVQRSVKFAKYLPEFGWRPTILTTLNASVPVQDNDLMKDVDPATTILRARTLEPGYGVKQKLAATANTSRNSLRRWLRLAGMSLLQPDPQVLWNPLAFRKAKAAIQETPHDAIYVTGPPFSSFLLGRALKRKFGLPLILDFRDEWLLASKYFDNHVRSGRAYQRQMAMFAKVLHAADAVLATTQSSAAELRRHIELGGGQANAHCIYNGFDTDDLALVREPRTSVGADDSDRLRIVYTGTLWKLMDLSPVVSALLQITGKDPDVAKRIDLVLVGRRTPQQDEVLRPLDATPIKVECHDYLPHHKSLELAASADVLLLLLADQPGTERWVPAKLFEYLALRKPILAICGEGELASLLRDQRYPEVIHPDHIDQIENWIRDQLFRSQRVPTQDAFDIQRFSRRELTRQLSVVLKSTLS